MVIHTIIDEYDLLYAQEREAAYAVSADCGVECGCVFSLSAYPLSADFTRLPEIKDNGGFFHDSN
ncbi:MAG: hypothetical protein ACI4I2_11845 [Oscillospiraceae bacterium]